MLRDLDFGLVAVTLDRIADIARPQPPVAYLRAADGVEVVHIVGGIFRHVQHLEVWEVHQHLTRRFRTRCEMEFDLNAVDGPRFVSLLDEIVGRNQRSRSPRQRLAEAGVDLPTLADGQRAAELVLRAVPWRCPRL